MEVKARCSLCLHDANGEVIEFAAGARLVSAGDGRRDYYRLLYDLIREARSPWAPVMFTYGVDTQAVEQNWRQVNRHKATLRHAGRELYMYLLHRIGHLLNLKRWNLS